MDSKIAEKNQNLTTAAEMRNQTMLVMQPYVNWEEYLTPAPLSIAILGELVFLSSKEDFSINKNPPTGGYKYIKYPDSFRACLMQVCNSGWRAFNEAHKNMDQTRLHTMAVPDYMKTVVKILFQDNDEVVKAHLPDQLENIRVIADECLDLATKTEQKFMDVINIIQELLEACVNAQFFYGEEMNAIQKKMEEAKLREKSAQEAAKRADRTMKAMEEQLKDAHEGYKNAMDSLPSGWELMGMDLVAGVTESLTTAIVGLTTSMTQPLKTVTDGTKLVFTAAKEIFHGSAESDVNDFDVINILSKSAEILSCTENIQKFVEGQEINWNDLYDQKNKATRTKFQGDQFARIKQSLEKSSACGAREEARQICNEGMEICATLAEHAPDRKCDQAKEKQLIDRIRNLTDSARCFDSQSKDVTKCPALAPKPPMMYKEASNSGKTSASQRASDNARFRIEQSRAQLDKTRDMYQKSVENMEKNQKELTDILVTMRTCELKTIDFNTTIKMLIKGMDAMGRVKEQWEKMVRFFQMVSNIVKTSLTRTLKDFANAAEKTQVLSYNAKLFSKDLLYNQAFQATNIANLINMIATTYTEVSNKHLMDRVSTLGKLMTIDKAKPDFFTEHKKLEDACDEAQGAILKLVLKNKEDFNRKTAERVEKIRNGFLAILPAADPQEEKRIQESVKSGFSASGYY